MLTNVDDRVSKFLNIFEIDSVHPNDQQKCEEIWLIELFKRIEIKTD